MNRRGLVRTACTARNAYNPTLALTSALVTSSIDASLRPSARQSAAPVSRRPFTRCSYVRQSAQANAPVKDEIEEESDTAQRPKQRGKGTFAGYEALMDTMGTKAPVKKAAKVARDSNPPMPIESAEQASVSSRERSTVRIRKTTGQKGGPTTQRRPSNLAKGRGARIPLSRADRGAENLGRDLHLKPRKVGSDQSRTPTLDGPGSEGLGKLELKSRDTPGTARAVKKEGEAPLTTFRHKGQESGNLVNDIRGWKAYMIHIGDLANNFAQHRGDMAEEDFDWMKSKCEYTGFRIEADTSSVDPPMPIPWVPQAEAEATDNTGLRRLDQEISLFAQYAGPDEAEVSGRLCVRNEVLGVFSKFLGEQAVCYLFGSDRTGLATMTSDLDFSVYLLPQVREGKSRKELDKTILSAMRELEQRLKRRPRWLAVMLRAARFPIINAQHRDSGLDVQIVASPTTGPQLMATQSYLQRIPTLRPLFFVLKTMLGVRGLVDVRTGGTGSYGLLMMLVASLTRGPIPPDPASQLLHFLDFYCTHDFTKNGIAIGPTPPPRKDTQAQDTHPEEHGPHPKTTLFRKHARDTIARAQYIRTAYARSDPIRAGQWSIGQRRPLQPYLPCIQDPANPLNDLGRKMNAIHHIVATFDSVRTELRARIKARDEGRLGEGESILEVAVGRCHELYAERRERVAAVGRERWTRMAAKAGRDPATREGKGLENLRGAEGANEAEGWEWISLKQAS